MNNPKLKIVVPGSKTLDFVLLEEIVRCEGLQNYTRLYLIDGRSIISSSNIGVFKSVLSNQDFFCTHKSHLVNINHITRYHKVGRVEMADKSFVPVARRKKEEFQQQILKSEEILSLSA